MERRRREGEMKERWRDGGEREESGEMMEEREKRWRRKGKMER